MGNLTKEIDGVIYELTGSITPPHNKECVKCELKERRDCLSITDDLCTMSSKLVWIKKPEDYKTVMEKWNKEVGKKSNIEFKSPVLDVWFHCNHPHWNLPYFTYRVKKENHE
jgi:hypothetical protein